MSSPPHQEQGINRPQCAGSRESQNRSKVAVLGKSRPTGGCIVGKWGKAVLFTVSFPLSGKKEILSHMLQTHAVV